MVIEWGKRSNFVEFGNDGRELLEDDALIDCSLLAGMGAVNHLQQVVVVCIIVELLQMALN